MYCFKERNRNKLKDYLTMAPALHVTHLLAFTLTPIAPSLRIVRLSSGPTLSFRVERYSLVKDVLNTSKRARSIGMEYLSSPLVSFPAPSLVHLSTPTSELTPVPHLARPRILPGSRPHNASAPHSPHEIIPISLPPALPPHAYFICSASCSPRCL